MTNVSNVNSNLLDVLITCAGGWPYPEKCIESILGRHSGGYMYPNGRRLPDGVRLLIRDNPSSKRDETYTYLLRLASHFGPERVQLYSPDWPGEHGHNLDFLVTKTTAEWALAIDSDLEFVTGDWLDKLMKFVERNTGMQCAVEMAAHNVDPNDAAYLPGLGRVPRIWTPRATTWFMLFKPSFVRDQGISFGRNDYEIRPQFRNVYPYDPPKFMRDSPVQRWTMENGWQLLWAGLYANGYAEYSLVQIPKSLRQTYVHHNHKISMFMQKSGDIPNAPTIQENWGKDIPMTTFVTGPGSK